MNWKTWGQFKSNVGSKSWLSYHHSSSVSSLLTLNTVYVRFLLFLTLWAAWQAPAAHTRWGYSGTKGLVSPKNTVAEERGPPGCSWGHSTQNRDDTSMASSLWDGSLRVPSASLILHRQLCKWGRAAQAPFGEENMHLSAFHTLLFHVSSESWSVLHRVILIGRDSLDQQVQPLTQPWH